jgi:H+/gluconate symporter-like permease
MQKGMGGTLGFLAIVVALGAMFGKILHGADQAGNAHRIVGTTLTKGFQHPDSDLIDGTGFVVPVCSPACR